MKEYRYRSLGWSGRMADFRDIHLEPLPLDYYDSWFGHTHSWIFVV